MSATTADPTAAEPGKGKGKSKLLLIVLALVVLGGAGGGGWFYLQSKKAHVEDEEEEVHASAKKPASPNYLALENMVVNLADPGGERVAQVGITLDLSDAKAADQLKAMMPAVRSSVLLLLTQRTSEELLKRDGKEKLAQDVQVEVARALGYEVPKASRKAKDADDEDEPPRRKARKAPASPVNAVLFSSFIVQ
ncbi:Flagellar basal body-associated protein FliL [Xylophilus ampelinus]|nr:flagellar basal body-associated FliL family protein [Variovorax sp.]VTY38851.1 Flagellar basal body-associated protein FliL [Xylophilus ampelinus]